MPLSLKRPRILAKAARAGAALYERERDLGRLLPRLGASGSSARVVDALAAAEAACDEDRRRGGIGYSAERHIRLLSALIVESKTARA